MFTSSFTRSTVHHLNRSHAAQRHIRRHGLYRHQDFAPNSPRALAAYHRTRTARNIAAHIHPAIQAPAPQSPITAARIPATQSAMLTIATHLAARPLSRTWGRIDCASNAIGAWLWPRSDRQRAERAVERGEWPQAGEGRVLLLLRTYVPGDTVLA